MKKKIKNQHTAHFVVCIKLSVLLLKKILNKKKEKYLNASENEINCFHCYAYFIIF